MATSRLEKIGTVFSRVTGLLRAGAMSQQDAPLWYNIYKVFPPKYEPRFDRPAPSMPVRNILYPEDDLRARFHKKQRNAVRAVDLGDAASQTATQRFINVYNRLREEGNIPEDQLFDEAVQVCESERQAHSSRVSTLDKPILDIFK